VSKWEYLGKNEALLIKAQSHFELVKDYFFDYSSISSIAYPGRDVSNEESIFILLFCIKSMNRIKEIKFYCPSCVEDIECKNYDSILIWDKDIESILDFIYNKYSIDCKFDQDLMYFLHFYGFEILGMS
jgi:hypothetical protein